MPAIPSNDGLTKIIALQIYETAQWYPCEVLYQTVGVIIHKIHTSESDKSDKNLKTKHTRRYISPKHFLTFGIVSHTWNPDQLHIQP